MKFLQQILGELGGDTLKAFTVIPAFGAYFGSVKQVIEFSPQKIVLLIAGKKINVTGEKLEIGKYFEQDLFIKGNIKVVEIE